MIAINSGVFVALMHNIAHGEQQLASQAATGMENGELAGRKIMFFEQCQGQSITIRQSGGGATGGRQPQGAGFLGHAHIQNYICILAQGGIGIAHHGDDFRTNAA